MATAIVAPVAERSAVNLVEKFADDLVDWIKTNPDKAHIRSHETPDTPSDVAFWLDVEDQAHCAVEDAVRNLLDQIGGPVPPGYGRRELS